MLDEVQRELAEEAHLQHEIDNILDTIEREETIPDSIRKPEKSSEDVEPETQESEEQEQKEEITKEIEPSSEDIDDILDEVEKELEHERTKDEHKETSEEVPESEKQEPKEELDIPKEVEPSNDDIDDLLDEVEKELEHERTQDETRETSEFDKEDTSHIDELLDEVESELEKEKIIDDILDEVERKLAEEDVDHLLDEIDQEVVEKERLERPKDAPEGEDLERYQSENVGAKAIEDAVQDVPTESEKDTTAETKEGRSQPDSSTDKTLESSETDTQTETHEQVIDPSTASLDDIEKTVEQHQHLKRNLKKEHMEQYEDYTEVMTEPDGESNEDIAQRHRLDVDQVESWRLKKDFPSIVRRACNFENERITHESEVPVESLEHRIEPESVVGIINEYREKEKLSVNDLSEIVERIYRIREETDSVVYAELHERGTPLVEDRLREIAQDIRANREIIEKELNHRLELDKEPTREVRVAVTDSRVYYWNKDASPDRWLNVLAKEKLYLKTTESKFDLLRDVETRLHIRGKSDNAEYYLNDVLCQMSHLENPPANRTRRFDRPDYFDGETFQFFGDISGRTLEDFKDVLSHMGTKKAARVENLRFPSIKEYRMKFVAMAESDCHLDIEEGRLSYYEKNPARRKIAIEEFSRFGDFKVKEDQKDNKRVMLPRTFGAIAEVFGIPRGDKAIRNLGLPDVVANEKIRVKVEYLRQMVPEDGSVGHVVTVKRNNVLHSGIRLETYLAEFGVEPKVNLKHIEFVCKHGQDQEATLCYEKGDVIAMKYSELKRKIASLSENDSKIAIDLKKIIDDNPNRLLDDEKLRIMKPLGIEMKTFPSSLSYYKKSERLSIGFAGYTASIVDTIRFLLIAPPDHPDKMKRAVEIITSRPEKVGIIRKEIEDDGLEIHKSWREFGI